MSLETVIDKFTQRYPEEYSIILLKTLAHPEQGGLGYRLKARDLSLDFDGFQVDVPRRTIVLDTQTIWGNHSDAGMAEHLRHALETHILRTRASLVSRLVWGTGNVIVGVVETGIGAVGILVPEPGTTAGGVALTALGVNTIGAGISQLSGANQNHGYNVIGLGFEKAGAALADVADLEPRFGSLVGRGVFLVSSIAVGGFGSIRVLRIPGTPVARIGVGGQAGGVAVGRIDMMYGSLRAKDGLTVMSINNNAGKSILRFVTHGGKLVVNGRIYGVRNVLRHEGNPRRVIAGLIKLLIHGAKS